MAATVKQVIDSLVLLEEQGMLVGIRCEVLTTEGEHIRSSATHPYDEMVERLTGEQIVKVTTAMAKRVQEVYGTDEIINAIKEAGIK